MSYSLKVLVVPHSRVVRTVSPSSVRPSANSSVQKVRPLHCHRRPSPELILHPLPIAMHALGIPTTRSLSLVSLSDLPVLRERVERACVLTRVAPSFLRIGSFEALNPPESMFFLGGGQQDKDLEALRILGEWVGKRILRLDGIKWRGEKQADEVDAGDAWGRQLVLESARRNAKMVAGWQTYGFMHGVINTDKWVQSLARVVNSLLKYVSPHSVSIMGLTIDYGPYAFMDVFDPYHICNHSDGEGRYNYQSQPSVVYVFLLRSVTQILRLNSYTFC